MDTVSFSEGITKDYKVLALPAATWNGHTPTGTVNYFVIKNEPVC